MTTRITIDALRSYLQGERVLEVAASTVHEDAQPRAEEPPLLTERQAVARVVARRKYGNMLQARPGKDEPAFPWKYRIRADGADALFLGGPQRDRTVSDLSATAEGAAYLDRLLRRPDLPDDLLDVVRRFRRVEL